ncbi:DNA/RNA nuclease SfsA [Rhodoligotrophos defluvii]|uniref:DNA/RNA nuclease SfsA n=1 Tax=Rhodoligotrophos defluvii TaxID=2561934 RepID=UPI0010C9D9BF|nr:DNA/RNA nuclease SfsA [Rhodoligotrophos defluvii]
MKLPTPLYRGRLIRRYKRFLADVVLDTGEVVTAHCANPGSMMGLIAPDTVVWLTRSGDPRRKLAYSWQLLELASPFTGRVGINTANPNQIAAEAIAAGLIPELAGYDRIRREVRYGRNSRIDLLLTSGQRKPCYVEVKNVHLSRMPGLAEFPDCVTSRGAKHLVELADRVAAGDRAVMLFVVQRNDCQAFALAADLDPAYARGFSEARSAGVECLVYDCRVALDEIVINRRLPFEERTIISARAEAPRQAQARLRAAPRARVPT